jgi:hypothetical protein
LILLVANGIILEGRNIRNNSALSPSTANLIYCVKSWLVAFIVIDTFLDVALIVALTFTLLRTNLPDSGLNGRHGVGNLKNCKKELKVLINDREFLVAVGISGDLGQLIR